MKKEQILKLCLALLGIILIGTGVAFNAATMIQLELCMMEFDMRLNYHLNN